MGVIEHSLHWFQAGGPVMYILLLASILTMAVIFERVRYYNRMNISFESYAQTLQQALIEEPAAEIRQRYEKSFRPADMIVTAGMRAAERHGSIAHSMESAAQLAAANLRRFLPLLSVLVTMAPLCGLLGTVLGMIHSFSVFDLQAGSAMAITGGVGEALVATASGLAVAVLALAAHSYFSYRLDNMVTDMEKLAAIIMDNVPQDSGQRRERHEAA